MPRKRIPVLMFERIERIERNWHGLTGPEDPGPHSRAVPRMAPLVVTPAPRVDESLLGFLLRVTEANGYPQLNFLFRRGPYQYSDFVQHRMSCWDVAQLTGRTPLEMSRLMYVSGDGPRLLGKPVRARELRLNKPRLCPVCVCENGYLQALWDCSLVVVCPVHRIWLLDHCGGCGRTLAWQRQGLLRCGCGANVETVGPPEEAPSALIEMTREVALHVRAEPSAIDLGAHLELIRRAGQRRRLRETKRRVSDDRLARYAASAWCDPARLT